MVTLGSKDTVLLDDDWTVGTDDGALGGALRAHLHADPDGPWVLTALDGGEAAAPTSVPGSVVAERVYRMVRAGGEYSLAAVSSARVLLRARGPLA